MRWLYFLLFNLGISVLFASDIKIVSQPQDDLRPRIVAIARSYLSVPYELAGQGRYGLDCSAFVQDVFNHVGIKDIPRVVRDQVHWGEALQGPLRPGDVIFYDTEGAGPSHVGIYVGQGKVIHAASEGSYEGVIESRITSPYYTKHFYQNRRFLSDSLQVKLNLDSNKIEETLPSISGNEDLSLALTSTEPQRVVLSWQREDKVIINRAMYLSHKERQLTLNPNEEGQWRLIVKSEDQVLADLTINYSETDR
ncbi:C40 family peptidase [Spirochaeta cellobiosiphila]|uniref:C40 family peptidase n=1 Tax=Spirochaeta cellobiosiphila TaxID=504483 RepID=UPI00146D180F|nr:C40 family peptidase [Spirochaeta cellobiosiphila]